MFDTIFGLPLHALVVHATVVVVPAAAAAVGLAAVWPRFRRWAGPMPLFASVVALVLVPVSVQSGQALQVRVGRNDLVDRHQDLGEGMLPWVIVLAVVAAGLFWLRRREGREAGTGRSGVPRFAGIALTVVSLIAAAGAIVHVVQVGHSGAEAAWSQLVEETVGE